MRFTLLAALANLRDDSYFYYKGFGLIFAEGYARKKRIILRLEIANYRAFSI